MDQVPHYCPPANAAQAANKDPEDPEQAGNRTVTVRVRVGFVYVYLPLKSIGLTLTLSPSTSSHAYYKQNYNTELEPMRSCTATTPLGPTNIQMPHGVDAG